ncbi:Protein CBG11552 [Caenorhabditis briggsae]|uniref:Protein CBG11552 n=2 Tax=Caenorhabditis briggsae TaxID=6238 RepID=A8XDG9_CAEBR|nr:Protein CBG11552 [Caenorhabditis briggsae]CAP30688.1 Protein CBG11552 [Caenorhabditis briggsae]
MIGNLTAKLLKMAENQLRNTFLCILLTDTEKISIQEITRHTDVGKRLESIKRVQNGIILRKNTFQRFTVMKSLQYLAIHPNHGPLLKLEHNYYLTSLEFRDLRVLNGSMASPKTQIHRFQQFLDFLAAAGHSIDPCSPDYFDLHFMEENFPSNHWYFVIAGSLGALAVVMIIDTIWFTGFQTSWEKKKLFELELGREKIRFEKSMKQYEQDEKWKKEAQEIKDGDKEYMDLLNLHNQDPFHAEGELIKWAEEKKLEQEKELRKNKYIEEREKREKAKEEKIIRQLSATRKKEQRRREKEEALKKENEKKKKNKNEISEKEMREIKKAIPK